MKQFQLFFCILLAGLFLSCETEPLPAVTGHVFGSISTRVENSSTSLDANAEALFNASGGITLTNQIFKYNGTNWTSETNIPWINTTSSTTLTALHPARNGQQFITDNPYSEEGLEDVLIAKSSFTNEKDIELTFKHLFSTLTIQILSPLRESVTRVSMEAPKIEALNADGSFSLSGTHQDIPELNPEGIYTFIIPPMENGNLTFNLTIGEETVSHPITHSFRSGYKYECEVKEPGIYNAKDLIEFSKLYNKKTADLSAYGQRQKDGRMLFRLSADIDFSEVNTTEFQPIGYDTEKQFNDIFDGQGHIISNINIRHSESVTGIFGRVSQNGIVKNLHLVNCSTPNIASGTSSTGVGFITGTLSGIISNCSVTYGDTTVESAASTGGLAGAAYAGSCIINSFVKNTTLVSSGYAGGVVGRITEGNITNCYSAYNTITRKTSYSGGFCGYAELCDITNCYVYQSTLTTATNRGQFIGYGKNASVSNCYTDKSTPELIFHKTGECTTSSNKIYNSSFVVESLDTPIWQLLEQWVISQNNSAYAQWTEDKINNLPAIFQ